MTGNGDAGRAPSWTRCLAAMVCGGAFLLSFAAIERFKVLGLDPYAIIPGLLLVVGLVALLRQGGLSHSMSTRAFLLACLGLFVISRLAAVILIPTEPVSDFRSYLRMAEAMARGEDLREVYGFFAWGYPAALAPWFAVFGSSVRLAQFLNVVAGGLSLLLVYPLGRCVGGVGLARCGTVLFLLWPAQLFLTPVLAGEHFALLLALGYLLAIMRLTTQPRRMVWSLLPGVILGLAYAVRPALGVLLPVGVIVLLLKPKLGARWACAGLLASAFLATQLSYRATLASVFHRTPPSVVWWNLLAGSNYGSRGTWNLEDAERFGRFATLEERNDFAKREIWRRLSSRPLVVHANLIRRKLKLLWAHGCYGAYWSTHTLGDRVTADWITKHRVQLFAFSQVYHLFLLLACALGTFRLVRGPVSVGAALLLLLIVSGSVLHAVFETQSRYSYVFAIGVLAFAAYGIMHPMSRAEQSAVKM